jgi:hypothetical protein
MPGSIRGKCGYYLKQEVFMKNSKKQIVITALVAVMAVVPFVVARTSANADSRYKCGSACNNLDPTAKVPGQSFKCSDDAKVVNGSNAYPKAANNGTPGQDDANMKVVVYYSHRCQTLWAKVTNSGVIGRTAAFLSLDNFTSGTSYQYSSFPKGTSVTTKMIDDHADSYGIGASVSLNEQIGSKYYAHYAFAY